MPGEAKKKPKRVKVSLHVYIDPDLADEVRRFIAASDPEVSGTAIVEAALRMYFAAKRPPIKEES